MAFRTLFVEDTGATILLNEHFVGCDGHIDTRQQAEAVSALRSAPTVIN